MAKDNPTSVFDAQLLEERLLRDKLRHELVRVETEAQLRAALQLPHDLIISETAVGDFGAGHALAILRELDLDIPLVVLTADIDEATLAGLLRAGAVDYVFKSRPGRVTQALRLAIVGLLGGTFHVDSRPGGGVRIVVTLPLAPRELP